MAACTHLDQVELTELPESVAGCDECLASVHGETRIPPSPMLS